MENNAIDKTCVILAGRQTQRVVNSIKKIIEYLNADLFLVYENDICNYSSHKNLKDKIKVKNYYNKSKVDNQYLKLKEGWLLMERFEQKNNIKYKSVFRLRADFYYSLDENIDLKMEENYVYLNTDFSFYGFRNNIKNCFLLYDFWYKYKNNNELENIKIIDVINTIKNNSIECFDTSKWRYLNKVKAIPIPVLKSSELKHGSPYSKNDALIILENINKKYKTYKDVLKNEDYRLYYWNDGDRTNNFPCELSILMVPLSKNIIPAPSALFARKV
tara:strand:- start:5549 stop:6370 length:822 start_codon:yes stop_codon:yes gene_type:complete